MSTPPPDQPGSPYQPPQQPGTQPNIPAGPPPGGQPPVGGYGSPVPAQHNPYAQPAGPYGPAPGQGPTPPYYGGPVQPGAQPGMAPGAAPGGKSGAGRAVLWAVVGAVVASALWGGGVLLLKGDSAKADLRGYTAKPKMCDLADISPFKTKYPKDTSSGTIQYTAKGKTLDEMYCDEDLEYTGSTFADAYVSFQVDLNKKTDPGPEFADTWLGWKQHDTDYKVDPLTGFGDESYLITEDTVKAGSGTHYVSLAVRDGWMTYYMTWSAYQSSLDTDPDKAIPTVAQATEWVKAATLATLPKLK
ncbi:hypothetical protein [Streptomyces sp. CA-111067]|uniref:hypothetical protein n=1 Tax=Streptomyces sp. CA-111067 TaxID=3240046 RepID=UPI003D965E12